MGLNCYNLKDETLTDEEWSCFMVKQINLFIEVESTLVMRP